MQESGKSPLIRLVLFIACISIAAAFIAGIYWYAVELPQQQGIRAPVNAGDTCPDWIAENIYCSCIKYGQAEFPLCMELGQQAYSCTIDAMQLIGMKCT